MNCEMAEGTLSAYLDDKLDPQLNQDVREHVEHCAQCGAVLADYRRFDALLSQTARVSPAPELRDRIFDSPAYRAIIQQQARSGKAGRSGKSIYPLAWPRTAMQAAAVLVVVLGSALLIRQGLFRSGSSSQRPPLTIGNPFQGATPLSAGPRIIFLRGRQLWSAPETGPEPAQRLTPADVTVAAWSISADGQMVAYVDRMTGKIHIIRSDSQSDTTVATIASSTLPHGFWSSRAGLLAQSTLRWSPDGKHLAFVSVGPGDATSLSIVTTTGGHALITSEPVDVGGAVVWNAAGTLLAFSRRNGSSWGVAVMDSQTGAVTTLTSQADPAMGAARAGDLAWVTVNGSPALTWVATSGTTLTGVFEQQIGGSGSPVRVSPDGVSISAAAFNSVGGGTWMLATGSANSTLQTFAVRSPGVVVASASASAHVTAIQWAPTGTIASYTTAAQELGVWTPNGLLMTIATHVTSLPVWSADGARVAIQSNGGIVTIGMKQGVPMVLTRLISASGPVSVAWAPDNEGVAISSSGGLIVAAPDGSLKWVDQSTSSGGALGWSIAG